MIGDCGIKAVTSRGADALNLLYRLMPQYWGRGYASEAACAVVSWARRQLPGGKIIARANLAFQRVAIKAGLHHDPSRDDEGEDGPDLIFTA